MLPGLVFRLVGAPRVTSAAIIVDGELVNESAEPALVMVAGMHVAPTDDRTLKRRTDLPPRPAPVPPPLRRCELAPGERIAFGASIPLDEYTWPSGAEIEIEWSFGFERPPHPRGRVIVRLP